MSPYLRTVAFLALAAVVLSGTALAAPKVIFDTDLAGDIDDAFAHALVQVLAAEGKPLSELLDRMGREYGALCYARRDIPCPTEKGKALAASFKKDTPRVVGSLSVSGVDDLDGVKLLFGGEGWILVRASGTEPVLRVYCEAPTDADVRAALEDLVARVSGG